MEQKKNIIDFLPRARKLRGIVLLGLSALLLLGNPKIANIVPSEPQTEPAPVKLHAPQVALAEPPVLADNKFIRLSYKASDETGIDAIALRVTPTNPLPGADHRAIEIALPIKQAAQIAQNDLKDLSDTPLAGQKVTLQIVATNGQDQKSVTEPVAFTLPEKQFFHPIARVLIEERQKLLSDPDNVNVRNETANIMAGIAHETLNYHSDPVVMMALRSGAVRLVLNRDRTTIISVNDILWRAATRIENGTAKETQHALHGADTIQDLSSLQDF